MEVGKLINQGKTKEIYEVVGRDDIVIMKSKDRITANNNAKSNDLEGKAAISTATTSKVFDILTSAGIKTHFVENKDDVSVIALRCDMIPIEWVTRRVATGSFLRRNPGVEEGHRFSPVKLETFFKDDENDDPQLSYEQLLTMDIKCGDHVITKNDIDVMGKTTVVIFEILEKYWASRDCALIDMKIEFGMDKNGYILLADVIDSDSWRLWPSGDKRLMMDKQVYRDMKNITSEGLQQVKRNFKWVSQQLDHLNAVPKCRVVVIMGSAADKYHSQEISKCVKSFGISCEMRVCSAHKSTQTALNILADYEGDGVPTVFVAVAGMSNGLGPVLSGNTCYPVINAPPMKPDWASQDIWSSLRVPSGLGCTTVLAPKTAALACAQIFALNNHIVWSKLRVKQLDTEISLRNADIFH